MNLQQLLNEISTFAIQQKWINGVTLGSVYDNWNASIEKKYGLLNIDIPSTIVNENMQQMHVMLYYGDRLAQDNSNEYEIKTTAELVLNNIINYIADKIGDVTEGWQINFFVQQFADQLAGGYVEFDVEVTKPIDSCTIDEYTTEYDDLIARLYAAIEAYAQENDELSILLKDILRKLTSERI